MIEQNVLNSITEKKEIELVEFENNALSVKLTNEGRQQLEDIVSYLQINQSNAVRMAISKLHKDIMKEGD